MKNFYNLGARRLVPCLNLLLCAKRKGSDGTRSNKYEDSIQSSKVEKAYKKLIR